VKLATQSVYIERGVRHRSRVRVYLIGLSTLSDSAFKGFPVSKKKKKNPTKNYKILILQNLFGFASCIIMAITIGVCAETLILAMTSRFA
jgi:hypothetical protein